MFCRALCLAAGRWAEGDGSSVDVLVLNDDTASDARYLNGGVASYVGARKSKARLVGHYLRRVAANKYDRIIFGHVYLSPLALIARLLDPAAKIIVVSYGIEVWQPLTKSQRRALLASVGSSRVDLQACKLEYSIVSPK